MFKRIRAALQIFRRTGFTWRTAWRHATPIGDWYTKADDGGYVEIVRRCR
jgi:hypothetical protein